MRQAAVLTRSGALYRDTRHGGENVGLADSVTASRTPIFKMDPSGFFAMGCLRLPICTLPPNIARHANPNPNKLAAVLPSRLRA